MGLTPQEKCTNCGREIGNLESPCVFKGNIVCSGCDRNLRSEIKTPWPKWVVSLAILCLVLAVAAVVIYENGEMQAQQLQSQAQQLQAQTQRLRTQVNESAQTIYELNNKLSQDQNSIKTLKLNQLQILLKFRDVLGAAQALQNENDTLRKQSTIIIDAMQKYIADEQKNRDAYQQEMTEALNTFVSQVNSLHTSGPPLPPSNLLENLNSK
jgi:hypothetical protein